MSKASKEREGKESAAAETAVEESSAVARLAEQTLPAEASSTEAHAESPVEGSPVAGDDYPSPAVDSSVADSPAASSPSWHHCQHRNKEFHVLAASQDEAKAKFARAVGVIRSIHPIIAAAVPGYEPTAADLELEKHLSGAGA